MGQKRENVAENYNYVNHSNGTATPTATPSKH